MTEHKATKSACDLIKPETCGKKDQIAKTPSLVHYYFLPLGLGFVSKT
jgi:hypothetical protein